MKIRFWHVAVVFLVLAAITVGGVILLYGNAMTPEPAPVEIVERRHETVITRTTPTTVGLISISGVVVYEDGSPAEGITVDFDGPNDVETLTETGPDGTFAVEVEGPVEVEPHVASQPDDVPISQDTTDLRFVIPQVCPLTVLVVDPKGEPVDGEADAKVNTAIGWSGRKYRDIEDGAAEFEALSCGIARVSAEVEGYPTATRDDVDTLTTQEVTLQLVDGVWLEGVVTDLDGLPLDEVDIDAADDSTMTGSDGTYGMLIDPDRLNLVTADKDGYESDTTVLRVSKDDDEAFQDFVLAPDRAVTVYCAGLENDSCQDLGLVMCTHPWVPFGEPCDTKADPVSCRCPEGVSAIRASGEAVRVEPEDTEAWLDFRYDGAIIGRVLVDGEPAGCMATAVFIPVKQSDLLTGISGVRAQDCDPEGRFQFIGLREGQWMVDITAGNTKRSAGTSQIRDQVVDLGDIELTGGGMIEGVVLDGLTGEGKPNVPVSAVQEVAGAQSNGMGPDGAMPSMGNAFSGPEGKWVMYGLEDGTYQVFTSMNPFDQHEVTVVDGEANTVVELMHGDDDLLKEHGFELVTDEGDLVVDAVDDGGSASEAGLQEGDRLSGVQIFGTDPASVIGGWDQTMTTMLLENYAGPGVTLVVERDGAEVEVDL
ncbi:MAG: hypothetical protein GY913_13480 [Proteobacteria bacterium]|nr:hypothetical protein [Pseudomonadota bacterium]MCP4917919.1 hypothetical protein [Pseudomonadota bacterium]